MSNSVLSQVLAMASKPYNEIERVEDLITPNYGLNLLQRLIKIVDKKKFLTCSMANSFVAAPEMSPIVSAYWSNPNSMIFSKVNSSDL